jgi:aldehyde:ferredoxin oxidoreductase
MREEKLDETTMRRYLGGYGLGARILFDRQKPGVDPLGPEATFGLVTGLLTGTDTVGGSRYSAAGKSPLTGGWGDANAGGEFGPYLKFSGYDAVFFTGISDKPVYLHINNGVAEIKDASAIWGKDTFETEDILRQEHGKDLQVACIGPAGEKVSLIAAIMNNKGRAAARSGLGAVMGSKRLKAVAVQGNMRPATASPPEILSEMRKRHVAALTGHAPNLHETGTPGIYDLCCKIDDAPAKNWAGVATIDSPNFEDCRAEKVLEKQKRRYACWRCPIACGGIMKANEEGEYTYPEGAHKPEYETMGMFGSNLCNDNLDSLIVLSDICNRLGLDTISAGACAAFVIECFTNGILTLEDTGGLEMVWGNHRAIVSFTEMLGKREGLGDIVADGVRLAAERIGKGSERYAMHIGGQEISAHDPRGGWGFAIGYGTDPTPGRHNQGGGQHMPGIVEEIDRAQKLGRGHYHKTSTNFMHAASSLGLCQFVIGSYPNPDQLIEMMKAVTGWEDLTIEELLTTGERITNVRQAFNQREGVRGPFKYPDRMRGVPPKEVGPRAGITFTHEEIYNEYLELMGWDTTTAMPSKAKLLELGLDDIAAVLHP